MKARYIILAIVGGIVVVSLCVAGMSNEVILEKGMRQQKIICKLRSGRCRFLCRFEKCSERYDAWVFEDRLGFRNQPDDPLNCMIFKDDLLERVVTFRKDALGVAGSSRKSIDDFVLNASTVKLPMRYGWGVNKTDWGLTLAYAIVNTVFRPISFFREISSHDASSILDEIHINESRQSVERKKGKPLSCSGGGRLCFYMPHREDIFNGMRWLGIVYNGDRVGMLVGPDIFPTQKQEGMGEARTRHSENRTRTVLCVQPSDWHIGEIYETVNWVRTFTLKNDGANAVRVVELVRTCICGELSIDRREIPPGEEAHLKLALDPGVLPPGPFVKTFYVRVEELAGAAGARDARPYRGGDSAAARGLAALPQGRIGGALGERALPGGDSAAREDTRPPMNGSAGSVVGVTVRGTVVPEWDVSPARHQHVASGGTAEFVVRPRPNAPPFVRVEAEDGDGNKSEWSIANGALRMAGANRGSGVLAVSTIDPHDAGSSSEAAKDNSQFSILNSQFRFTPPPSDGFRAWNLRLVDAKGRVLRLSVTTGSGSAWRCAPRRLMLPAVAHGGVSLPFKLVVDTSPSARSAAIRPQDIALEEAPDGVRLLPDGTVTWKAVPMRLEFTAEAVRTWTPRVLRILIPGGERAELFVGRAGGAK